MRCFPTWKDQIISIHAPARGATGAGSQTDLNQLLFQSTPPRGGRLEAPVICLWSTVFQSTPPRGGRHLGRIYPPHRRVISIHAPARGATQSLQISFPQRLFQSTPPRGGRLCKRHSASGVRTFQSTPPRGGRQQKQPKFQAAFTTSRQFFQISPPNSDSISKNKVTCSRKTPRNLVRTCGDFPRTCASHLKHQHILRSIGCLYSKMLNLLFVAVPQVVKTQTVFFLIHDFT